VRPFYFDLELEPHFERALSRGLERASADIVDEPESTCERESRVGWSSGRSKTGCGRVLHFRSVENVLEVHPHGERSRSVLAEFEDAAGFSTRSFLGSMQWQFRSFRNSGCPATRFANVDWNSRVFRLFVDVGARIGRPLA
jgi:hypothetical protein